MNEIQLHKASMHLQRARELLAFGGTTQTGAAHTRPQRNSGKVNYDERGQINLIQMTPKISKNFATWPELSVRESVHGKGVFANVDLQPGVMIPILAYKQSGKDTRHQWYYKGFNMNGSPSLCPHGGVGSRGFAVAMMINEASKAKDMNCILSRYGHVIVIKTCKQNQELLTWYGKDYDRNKYNYKLSDNKKAYEGVAESFFEQNYEANFGQFSNNYGNLRTQLWKTGPSSCKPGTEKRQNASRKRSL